MRKYSLICAYCDSEFESSRKDALYCSNSCRTMNSRDNKQKERPNTNYKLDYSDEDNEVVVGKAEISGMEVDEYIKYISIHSIEDYSGYISEINELSKENKQLKAKLCYYTNDLNGGIFLDVDEETIVEMYKNMKGYGKRYDDLEEYIIYASTNLMQIVTDTINKVIDEVMKKFVKKQ
jgi:hypothetical protein